MITVLRLLLGTGCLVLGATFISVALRQYRREMTWSRTRAIVQRQPGARGTDLAYTDPDGRPRIVQHWGVSSTVRTGELVTLLVHPHMPERIALPFGGGVLAMLAIAGIAIGVLGLLMLGNVFAR